MRYTIENEFLKVTVDSFGAEIKSVIDKSTNKEFMWQADPEFWGRTSPVLFPFVGGLKNKEYTHNGVTYKMGQHGFARDLEHNLECLNEDSISFTLSSNEETLSKYPFGFELKIGYLLSGRTVTVSWEVINAGDDTMYFSIGAHPAFNCPLDEEGSKNGMKIHFEDVNEIHHHGNDVISGLSLKEDIVMPLHDGMVTVTKEFFDRCTYMIEGKQTKAVSLVDRNNEKFVTVRFDAPLFALWSPEGKNAPFICIEPWFGRCDAVDFFGELKDREYTNVLLKGENFKTDYSMIFGK